MSTMDKVRKIVQDKSAAKIDGIMVDMFTASAIVQVYNKVNDANKAKMDGPNVKIGALVKIAHKVMGR